MPQFRLQASSSRQTRKDSPNSIKVLLCSTWNNSVTHRRSEKLLESDERLTEGSRVMTGEIAEDILV